MATTLTAVSNSSLIAADSYDPGTETLTIQFQNGDTWAYSGVDPRTAESYDQSESKGKYFLSTIKRNVQGVKLGA